MGKACVATGQASGALHNSCSMLLSTQTWSLSFAEPLFALHATKQADHAISCSLAILAAIKQHLWLNLSLIKEKERSFLLDTLVLPSGLFDARSFGRQSLSQRWALQSLLPTVSFSSPSEPVAGPSGRQEQEACVATKLCLQGCRRQPHSRPKKDLREVNDTRKQLNLWCCCYIKMLLLHPHRARGRQVSFRLKKMFATRWWARI